MTNGNDDLKCFFIPKDAIKLHTLSRDGKLVMGYETKDVMESKSTNILAVGQSNIWTVIPHFKLVVACNLSFFASSSGWDVRSHCRCTYCNLSSAEWRDSSVQHTDHNLLSLKQIQHYASIHSNHQQLSTKSKQPDTKGVIMPPILHFEPADYIVPLLHLLIGIFNKAWISMLFFLKEFVENVSDYEANMKDKLHDIEKDIYNINDKIDLHTVNMNMSYVIF